MKIRVYEVEDEDVLHLFFGEEQKYSPIYAIAANHGELIWEGRLSTHPAPGDVLCIDGADKGVDEYVVVCRAYHADTDSCVMIVHGRHQVEVGLS